MVSRFERASAGEFALLESKLRRVQSEASGRILRAITVSSALTSVLEIVGDAFRWMYGEAWTPRGGDIDVLERIATWSAFDAVPDDSAASIQDFFDDSTEEFTLAGRRSAADFEETGVIGRAAATKQAAFASNADQDALAPADRRRLSRAATHGVNAIIAIPLCSGDRLTGVLVFYCDRAAISCDLERFAGWTCDGLSQLGEIVERKQVEAKLTDAARQQSSIARLGRFALSAESLNDVWREAAHVVARTLKIDQCAVLSFGVDGQFHSSKVESAVGWNEARFQRFFVDDEGSGSARERLAAEAVVIEIGESPELSGRMGQRPEIASLISAPIQGGSAAAPFGAVVAITDRHGRFSSSDLHFLQAIANLLSAALCRRSADEAHAQLAAIVESSEDSIIGVDASGDITAWNAGAEHMFGYERSEVLGRPISVIAPDREGSQLVRAIQELTQNSSALPQFEAQWRNRDGREIIVSVRLSPLRDRSGAVVGASAIARDITEKRTIEDELNRYRERLEGIVNERTSQLQSSHERLRSVERLASIGTLAAGLGHDMNNLLFSLRCRLDSADTLAASHPVAGDLRAIRESLDYLQKLSEGLRLLSADPDQARGRERVDNLARWWSEIEPWMTRTIPREAKLIVKISDRLPPVAVAPHRLTQAIFNLLVNAGEAIPMNGEVRIDASTDEYRHYVVFAISDNGAGMSDDVRRRALDPFFTTKTRGLSTGLGLSVAHGIIKAANGTLDIQSQPGAGTTVRIGLPIYDQSQDVDRINAARTALIDVKEPRTVAALSALLQSLRFNVRIAGRDEPWPEPALVILDDSRRSRAADGADGRDGETDGPDAATAWTATPGVVVILVTDQDPAQQQVEGQGQGRVQIPGHLPNDSRILIAPRHRGLHAIRQAIRDAIHELRGETP